MYCSEGIIATSSFKIPAKRTLYHIFIFREHWLIVKSSTCLSVIEAPNSRGVIIVRTPNSCATMSVSPKSLEPFLLNHT